MRKIAIIGANSYIARNVIYKIKQLKEDITLRLYDCAETQSDGETEYTSIDIHNRESVSNINMNCDIIYMFIGKTGSADGFDNYSTFIEVNEVALLHVLDEYRKQNSKAKIIFPSTRLVYKGRPGKLIENAEKEFKSIYAINKYACETYLKQFHDVYNVKYCIFRICIPYGTLIPQASSYGTAEYMLKRAEKGENIILYGDGSVRRTLTYMGDLCDALINGAFCEQCVNDVFNIGGEDYSLREMAGLIANKYGVNIELIDYPKIAEIIESGDTVFDSSKIDILGIQCRFPFEKWISKGLS